MQAIDDQQVLKSPRADGRKRLQEAKALTWRDYEEKIAGPRRRLRDGADGSLSEVGSLRPIVDRLRANPRVHIMHNADDILADGAAIVELKAVMGDQMTLYPSGGHLGNLWYAENQEDILRFFQGPVPTRAVSIGRPPEHLAVAVPAGR